MEAITLACFLGSDPNGTLVPIYSAVILVKTSALCRDLPFETHIIESEDKERDLAMDKS